MNFTKGGEGEANLLIFAYIFQDIHIQLTNFRGYIDHPKEEYDNVTYLV